MNGIFTSRALLLCLVEAFLFNIAVKKRSTDSFINLWTPERFKDTLTNKHVHAHTHTYRVIKLTAHFSPCIH